MESRLQRQCLEAEMEYREWREAPFWFCVKTIFNEKTGAIKSEIMKDDKTKVPITIQDVNKPQDGTFHSGYCTTYYTYHASYDEAVAAMAN